MFGTEYQLQNNNHEAATPFTLAHHTLYVGPLKPSSYGE